MTNPLFKISQKISPGLQKIFHNFSWLLAERMLNMLIALTIGIYLIRYLGVKDFGALSYAFSFVNIFDGLSKFGLDAIVIRNLVQEEEQENKLLGTAFLIKTCTILTSIITSIIIFRVINQNANNQQLMIIIAFSLIFNTFDVIDFWFQSKLLSQPMVMVRSTQVIVSSILKLIFIFNNFSVIAFAGLYLVEGMIKMFGMLIAYRQQKRWFSDWQWNLSLAKELLADAWPLALSSLMVIIYIRIDQVMLGIMTTEKAVGLYSAAIRFSEIWYFIPVIICSSVFPTIVKIKSQSEELYHQRLQQLYDLLMWGALTLAVLVSLTAYPMVNLLLGNAYKPSATILIIHIWALPFVFLGVGRSQWLVTENLNHFNFWATSLGAISNILLNWLLIPTYEGLGAAIATVISYGLAAYLSCGLYQPIYPTFWMLTKALLIPFRWQQNHYYWTQIYKTLQSR